MSQNMESLLMGDSSSGESEDESNVPMRTTTTAASTVAAPRVAAPKPAPAPAPSRGKPGANMARLKNLYTMSKQNPAAPKPLQRPPMQQQQQPTQRQQQQQQLAPPQQQQIRAPTQQRQRPMHQPHQTAAQQQQHKRSQLYQQSQQQKQQQQQQHQQQQQIRQPTQPRQPQYAQPSSQQRPQYSQAPQQSMQSRPQAQPRQSQYPQSSSQQRQQYSQQAQQQRQPQSRGSSQQPSQVPVDPFAPTPLDQIKQRSSHRPRTHPQQQMASQRPSTQTVQRQAVPRQQMAGSTTSQQEVKRNKEKFLMFTRVLIKYLEQKDPRMHAQAKSIIKDCAERNKKGEPGYESVTLSMKRRLRDLVGDHYWKKAHDYLTHFIEQKKRQAGIARPSSGSAAQQAKQQMRQRQLQQQQQQQQQRLQQQRQQELQRRTQEEKLKKQQQKPRTSATPTTAKGIQDKQLQETKAASKTKKTTAAKADSKATTSTTKKTTKKTVTRRKSTGDASTSSRKSTTTKASATTTQTIVKKIVIEEPPREYKELMELVDHSVEYDWPSIGQLLGNKADLKLSDEELQLLYGDNPPQSLIKKKTKTPTKTTTPEASSSAAAQEAKESEEAKEETKTVDGIRPGWSQTNVVSARAAWSRIRLKEVNQKRSEAASSAPIVGDGLLSLPTAVPVEPEQPPEAEKPPVPAPTPNAPVASTLSTPATPTATPSTPGAETESSPKPAVPVIENSWVNDETAEQDKALALLSEGCQIYLKGVLQKAVQCARQRQNLDGIRLWHQQYAFSKGISSVTSSALSKESKKNADKSKKPPLALRLGCDVSRQVAQAQGNAALTVKRMEEALDRQTGIPMRVRELNQDTMLEATSMGDLSWRPLLKKGAEKADIQAKRSFEVYGGSESKDPPLGRVPKKANLMVEDFVMGAELTLEGPYHKAYTASSFLSF